METTEKYFTIAILVIIRNMGNGAAIVHLYSKFVPLEVHFIDEMTRQLKTLATIGADHQALSLFQSGLRKSQRAKHKFGELYLLLP